MTSRRARRAVLAFALLALAPVVRSTGNVAAAAPPTLPPGYVELVDDTGAITMAVPATWTDVVTTPLTSEDGTPTPYIGAGPDLELFQSSFDVSGAQFFAMPYTAVPQMLIDEYGLTSGCTELETVHYDDGVFVGLAQVGTSCGSTGEASWVMVSASPADHSLMALVQVQSATAADEEAVDTVLATFNVAGVSTGAPTSSIPAPAAPGASVPAGLGPVDVARLFLDALTTGDGTTACALLAAEEMTINFVENAASCPAELAAQVAGQGEFWASVEIAGDEFTSSDTCDEEAPDDDYVSLELQGPTDDGCLSIGVENGEWRIEDLSNSIWNQAR